MKKTRKILSIVLAVIFAFGSMPAVHISTGAADAVTYAAGQTGTLENPTKPVEASGVLEFTDIIKLNINSQSTSYTFYQTIDNEYFTFGQTQGVQHYNGDYSAGSRTLTFENIDFYRGETSLTNPVLDTTHNIYVNDPANNIGEDEVIQNNPTAEFLDNYYVSNVWTPSNTNAETVSPPFVLDGSGWDVAGCKVYTWVDDIIFHGHSADASGEINTGYYETLKWNWVDDDDSTTGASFELRIGTDIRVLDARELAKEIAEAEAILENPDGYTTEYLSSVEATLNTIPDDLRDFSKVYDQSEIDTYTQMLKDVSLNSADYTEYNQIYKSLKSITNAKGAFTDESFEAFEAEIAQINANLPKNLDKTQQATVDEATQALKDAYEKLIATDVSESKTPGVYTTTGESSDDGRLSVTLDNTVFYFMQTKDDQVFELAQTWTISRGEAESGTEKPNIYGLVLDTSELSSPDEGDDNECLTDIVLSPNNTSTFISQLADGEAKQYTASDEKGNSVTNYEFTSWNEVDANGNDNADTTVTDSTGLFNPDRSFEVAESSSYYFEVSPQFKGMSADESGEATYNFLQRMGTKFVTGKVLGIFGGTTRTKHFHFNTTISITDVRMLISAVEEAEVVIANPGTHSDSYITALQAAVDSVPVEMLRGVEYYTQEEVDKLYSDITTIPEDVADYSEFVEVFESMMAENKDKFTEESYEAFIDEIYAINQNLPKNLTADQQSTVDEAVDALYAAHDKLISVHLNDDNVFTEDDISDLGNNPLAFTVSSNEYNFMQIADGQQFAIRTELTARNTKARYNCSLLSLRFSTVTADTVSTVCEGRTTPDNGCHGGEAVLVNQSQLVLDNVTGVTQYEVNDAGDIGEHTTWVNTSGVALSTDGVLNDPTELSTTASSAYAEYYYTGASGNTETPAPVNVQYALRLGWSYYEEVLGVDGETIRRHAHIPVSVNITDARALNALYEDVDDILNGKTDKNYTFASLLNLYNTFNTIDSDMAYGNTYYTQDEVNAAYESLNTAYNELNEGADYSDYFKAYVQAEEIINSGNTDSRGNALYDEATYTEFVETVTAIDTALDKDLSDSAENQAIVDTATNSILEALAELETTKRADYSELNDAMTEAEEILNAPEGTYTDETLDAVKEAYDNAVNLDKELPASEQATVDAVASALQAAIEDKEYKADYSDFDEAYKAVEEIASDTTGKYTDATIQAAKEALAQADTLDKDLADTAANREAIASATDALNSVIDNAEEKADYTEYENAKSEADALINAGATDENGNDIYVDGAFEAYQEAVNSVDSQLDKDLSVDNQSTVDEATSALEEAMQTLENNKKADYTEFNAAKDALEEIVNNPDDYTSASVEAAQKALDSVSSIPDGLPVGENNQYQNIIDNATASMNQVLGAVEKRADYTEFDKAYEQIEEILNNPDKYTEETVQAAQTAKDAADQVGTDQPLSNQEIVDQITDAMNQVIENKQEYADYTDYNNAKAAADEIINAGNTDENGNPIYNEEAYNAYVEAVNKIDSELPKNLTSDYQSTVDEAAEALKDLRTELDASSMDYDEVVIDPETAVDDTTVQDIVDEVIKNLTENSGYSEDELIVEFKDYLGNELAGESFVGTGSTMRIILKSTGELLDYKLFIVMGDVDGDGDVDGNDYQKSMNIGLKKEAYSEEHKYFFTANDMSGDGYIDVLDCALIRRMF